MEIKKSIAHQIKESENQFEKILKLAEEIHSDSYQDWENGISIFIFKDGSKIKITSEQIVEILN